MELLHNPKCFNNHLGPWMVEPEYLHNAVKLIKAGLWKIRNPDVKIDQNHTDIKSSTIVRDNSGYLLYQVLQSGIAVIQLSGFMMKGESKFEDSVSTLRIRGALRSAKANESVKAIMLLIDSPGGTVAGTQELAEEVANTSSQKPVYGHIDDLGASAALWIASQTKRLTANSTAMVGSIGTLGVIHDTSEQAKMEGVKVHVLSTGDFKGAFTDGTPVTPDQLAYYQDLINGLNKHFLNAVAVGRKMDLKDVNKIADGKVYLASEAKKLGLIDAVMSFDESLTEISNKLTEKEAAKNKARTQKAAINIARLKS